MSEPRGFLTYPRQTPAYRPVEARRRDHFEVVDGKSFDPVATREQAARCMDCGVPFCQSGCPLGNYIPEFNAAVQQNDFALAYALLRQTNNFPEFTGRICPAPCEHACVLGINQEPVTIEHLERTIIERAFAEGWVQPQLPRRRTGRKVAVVGSGPAGLAAADELNRQGHSVTVFEKNERPGGLLRYGIPDFKLEKWVVERRIGLLQAEGVAFRCGVEAGRDISGEALLAQFDAVLLCSGALQPRDLSLPGRELAGVHFAMDYLQQHNRRVAGRQIPEHEAIVATDRHVVVIGGGDTGSDCVGTANRQGARSVTQLQYHPMPPAGRPEETPWPLVPATLTTSSSHEEGCERAWEIQTKAFTGTADGQVKGLRIVDLAWQEDVASGHWRFVEVPDSAREIPCNLALIAIGYRGGVDNPLFGQLGLQLNEQGLLGDAVYRTANARVFAAGDARRGQSLVVWAIAEGRAAAGAVHTALLASG